MREAFSVDGLVHVLEEFEGELNVELIAAQDFLERIYQLGMPQLTQVQVACLVRVLGK